MDASACGPTHLPQHRAIFDFTYGILFMGTPQMGADYEPLAKHLRSSHSVSHSEGDVYLKSFESAAEPLQYQLVRYVAIQGRFETKVYYEKLATDMNGLPTIVSAFSYV